MRLSYNDVWNEAVAQVRRDRPLLVALGGAFFFLPNLIVGYFAPLAPPRAGVSLVEAISAHVREHWAIILGTGLVEMLGILAVLNLLLKADGRTVGAAIGASLALLPTMFVAGFLSNVAVFAGLILLLVPGIYLLGRLALVPASIVAENRRNPFDAIGRSFALTRRFGFAVAGIFVIVFVIGAVLDFAVTRGFGSIVILLVGRDPGLLIAEIGSAVVWAAVNLLQVALAAIIYLRLAAAPAVPASG